MRQNRIQFQVTRNEDCVPRLSLKPPVGVPPHRLADRACAPGGARPKRAATPRCPENWLRRATARAAGAWR